MVVLETHDIKYCSSVTALKRVRTLYCMHHLVCTCHLSRYHCSYCFKVACNSLIILLLIGRSISLKLIFPAKEWSMILVQEVLWLSVNVIGLGHSFINAVLSYLFLCVSACVFCLFTFLRWDAGDDAFFQCIRPVLLELHTVL